MLDLCCCTQSVSCTPRVIPGLGQPLPFHPRPLDLEIIQTLTWRRPELDNIGKQQIYKAMGRT